MVSIDTLSKKHKKQFHLAYNEAICSEMYHKLGATIVMGGKIMGTACNSALRQCYNGKFHCSGHAEHLVLRKCQTYRRAAIYVVRVRPDGTVGMARPCQECTKQLKLCGIRTIYYTTNQQTLVQERVSKMTSTHLSIYQRKKN